METFEMTYKEIITRLEIKYKLVAKLYGKDSEIARDILDELWEHIMTRIRRDLKERILKRMKNE